MSGDPYLCAGCGVAFINERKQCACPTGIGFRRSDGMQIVCEQCREVTIPYDEYQALIARAACQTSRRDRLLIAYNLQEKTNDQ